MRNKKADTERRDPTQPPWIDTPEEAARRREWWARWREKRRGTIWWDFQMKPNRIDLENPPMTDGAAMVLIDARAWQLVKAAALVADTPRCRTFLSSAQEAGMPVTTGTEWARQSGREDFERHAKAVNPAALRSDELLAEFAAAVFEREVPRVFVAVYCDGARHKKPAETAVKMILGSEPGWGHILLGASLSVIEDASRGVRESEVRKIEYRRDDKPENDAQLAEARSVKAGEDDYRAEWIASRYLEERPKFVPGRSGNRPAMQAVADLWAKSGPGRRISRDTVARILRARGIDYASPATDATPRSSAEFNGRTGSRAPI